MAILRSFAASLLGIAALILPVVPPGTTADETASKPPPHVDLYGDPLPEGAIARIGSVRLRHVGLSHFRLLPDGRTAVTGGSDQLLRFWNTLDGKLVRTVKLEGSNGPVLSFSPDGRTVASTNHITTVFWDTSTGKSLKSYQLPIQFGHGAFFSPEGTIFTVDGGGSAVTLLDWQSGKKRQFRLAESDEYARVHVSFSPDGKLIAVSGHKLPVCVYDVATLRQIHRLECVSTALAFSPDSKRLAIASYRKGQAKNGSVIRLFDMADGKEVATFPAVDDVASFALAFSPDGKTLACGGSYECCLLDAATGRILQRLPDQSWHVQFGADGKTVFSTSGNCLRAWDVTKGEERHARPGDLGCAPPIAISPDGKTAAACDFTARAVDTWELATGRLLRSLPVPEPRAIANLSFSRDGHALYLGQADGSFRHWNAVTGEEQRHFQIDDFKKGDFAAHWCRDFHIMPDGKTVSTLNWIRHGDDDNPSSLASWDVTTGKLIREHKLPSDAQRTVWSDDGSILVYYSQDHVNVMETETGTMRFRAGDVEIARGGLSPDDRVVVATKKKPESATACSVGIWEVATGGEAAAVSVANVDHFAVAMDNRSLVTTSGEYLRVWDLATGSERTAWRLARTAEMTAELSANGLRMSPDGRRAFTAMADGTGLIWDLTPALQGKTPLVKNPTATDIANWWDDLANADAKKAYAAIWRLAEVPPAMVVAHFRPRLKPAAAADFTLIRKSIDELDSPTFTVREKAFRRLEDLGGIAHAVMREALAKNPSAEVRRQLETLLARPSGLITAPSKLQRLRAIQVLERLGTKDAQELLNEIASGTAQAIETKDAKAALARMGLSPAKP